MLGVCYYPEQWPEARWAEDARLMRACGLKIVRIGEFAWGRIEPRENAYDWTWLDRAIDTLAAAGLKLILGTPTATPPAWLTQRHPDVLRVGADGRRWSHGGRRHTCPTSAVSATYAAYTRQIVGAMSERYGTHPAVVAWQIDNELSNHATGRCYCDQCRAAFQRWCCQRYGSLEHLNEAWGTSFWSQCYSDWGQIPVPSDPVGGGHNPSLQLAYRRFSSDTHVQLVRNQATQLRQNSPGRTITTNIAPLDNELDWHAIAAEVDVMSWDNYPHGFKHPADVAFFHDLVRGLKRRSFWVMEQQAGRINWTSYNPPVPAGQVRLWTYQAIAHGAEDVLYFRWRASRYGQEQYHSGLLNHDASLAQGYYEAQQIVRELADHPPLERLPAEVALLISYPDAWSTEIEPHHADFDYWQMARTIYRDFWLRGINVDIIARGQDLRQYRHVIPVAPQLIDEDEAKQWRAFVRDGGKLTLTIRSFIKDQDNVWTDQPWPAGLTDLGGGQVVQWYALPPGVTGHYEHDTLGPIAVPIWIEDVHPDDPRTTLQYTTQSVPGLTHLISWSNQPHGSRGGSAEYIGVYPPDPRCGLFSGTSLATTGTLASPLGGLIERVRLKAGELVLNHATVEQWNSAGEQMLPSLGVSSLRHRESGEHPADHV